MKSNSRTKLFIARKIVYWTVMTVSVTVAFGRTAYPPEYGMEGPEKELMLAVCQGNVAAVKNLIEKGTNVNATNALGRTVLGYAVWLNDAGQNTVIVRCLITAGANVNANDSRGPSLVFAVLRDNIATAKLLITAGADVNAKMNGSGNTALMLAKQKEMAKLLIESGADVNAINGNGDSILAYVATYGHNPDVIKLLIEKKASVNMRGGVNGTALLGAVSYGKMDVVKLLIDAGADVNMKNCDGETALDIATKRGDKEMIDMLKSKGSKVLLEK